MRLRRLAERVGLPRRQLSLTFLLGQFSAACRAGGITRAYARSTTWEPDTSTEQLRGALSSVGRKLLGLLGPTWIAVEGVSGFTLILRALVFRGKFADRAPESVVKASSELSPPADSILLIIGAARVVLALLMPFVLCLVVCLCRLAWELDLRRSTSANNEPRRGLPPSI